MKRTIFQACVRLAAPLLLTVAMVSSSAHTVSACPTCSDAVAANDPEHEHMVKGYFYSILFMMGMPYLLLTSFGLYMYWEVKKARARNAAAIANGFVDPNKPLAPASAAAVPAIVRSDEAGAQVDPMLPPRIVGQEHSLDRSENRELAEV
ncbi:MAG TPA: hypothetical protein VGI75_13845 [Pirellulales bacterium]